MKPISRKALPFLVAAAALVLDQSAKLLVTTLLPLTNSASSSYIKSNHLMIEAIPNWLWIIHIENARLAFGIAGNLPPAIQYALLFALPIVFFLLASIWYLRSSLLFTRLQAICFGLILGGSVANDIDRIFRDGRVVDFIYPCFLERLGAHYFYIPNLGDLFVAIAAPIFLAAIILSKRGRSPN